MSRESDRVLLLAHLHRNIGYLPWVPESMTRTLHASCLKAIRRLSERGWISGVEVVQLSTRVRDIMRDRDPSRCGFEHNTKD